MCPPLDRAVLQGIHSSGKLPGKLTGKLRGIDFPFEKPYLLTRASPHPRIPATLGTQLEAVA